MTDQRPAPVGRWDGEPARFAVLSVAFTVLWFPFRLWLDHGNPIAAIIALSGLYGVCQTLVPYAIWWMRRRGWLKRLEVSYPEPPATAPEGRSQARRSAIIGLSVGVPFYGALLGLCLITGRFWLSTTIFGVALAWVVAIAVVRLRQARGSATSTGRVRSMVE